MKTINFEVKNSVNETIRARFITPFEVNDKVPLVIMLTGDGPKGSNSLGWTNLSPKLSDKGIATFLFDFSGLGNSEGSRKFLTLSKGISDFRIVFEAIKGIEWIDFNNIGIMASSFGASVALHCYQILNSVKAIGLKSPSCFLPDAYINEISQSQLEAWILNGYCEENSYSIEVLLDPFKYNIFNDVKKITTRCLITHGKEDEVVPVIQSKYLDILLNCPHKLILFENCDHGYSTGNNWDKMANLFVEYFIENLT